jgi:transposase
MDGAGILSRRHGWSVHHGWRPYFKYDVRHALCNAHHLRELTFMADQYQQQWAVDLRHWLCQIKNPVEQARSEGRKALLLEQIAYFNQRYTTVLYSVEDKIGLSPPTGNGRQKNSPAANLLNRLTAGR